MRCVKDVSLVASINLRVIEDSNLNRIAVGSRKQMDKRKERLKRERERGRESSPGTFNDAMDPL
jgi:hypothetical protein